MGSGTVEEWNLGRTTITATTTTTTIAAAVRVRVTAAEGGPWPSGDGEAVEQLNLQDLHDLQAQDFAICD